MASPIYPITSGTHRNLKVVSQLVATFVDEARSLEATVIFAANFHELHFVSGNDTYWHNTSTHKRVLSQLFLDQADHSLCHRNHNMRDRPAR